MDISCIVLAGGKGSRLGHNKAEVIIGGKSLFQRVLCRVSFLKSEVIVVASADGLASWPAGYSSHKVVADIYPDRGPLVGIYTGLTTASSFHSLAVGCDMPFLNRALLSHMIKVAPGFDVVIPRVDDMVEPLHALYSKNCLAPIEDMVERGDLSVHSLLGLVRVRYVDSDEIDRFDPEHLSLFNVNTPDELDRARSLVEQGAVVNDKC
ncbi:MAG TPA: molybdenum cofactor guanylyltransferase [Dehalococcoidia bacterium]|nr:molybdenum cofactor guanylyltransferase [Dehalococcoidia bacterium]